MTGAATLHDVIGVGIGPFNLGLAALLAPLDVDAVLFDERPAFSWHPGLLLEGTTLQVPFLADLVTMADPTNPYSFLNYLHCQQRLYRFYFHERFHIPRTEYSAYCRWVAESLDSCRFGQRVTSVHPVDDGWVVTTRSPDGTTAEHHGRAVVMGVGSRPWVPACAEAHVGSGPVLHTAGYLARRDELAAAPSVTVIGSGQSAAEVVADLLGRGTHHQQLRWFTRSRGFLPMEYSKLGLEHFSPDYTAYFHRLPEQRRDRIRSEQDLLYKGISAETSARIFDLLYERSVAGVQPDVGLFSSCELGDIQVGDGVAPLRLTFRHSDEHSTFSHNTHAVVLGTGYEPAPLPLSDDLTDLVERDGKGRPVVDLDHRLRLRGRAKATLFVQNAELHSHGVGTPDLGLGAHRNAVIANALLGREAYPVRDRNVFQHFGAPTPQEHPA